MQCVAPSQQSDASQLLTIKNLAVPPELAYSVCFTLTALVVWPRLSGQRCAHEKEGPWDGLQEVGHVLRAHGAAGAEEEVTHERNEGGGGMIGDKKVVGKRSMYRASDKRGAKLLSLPSLPDSPLRPLRPVFAHQLGGRLLDRGHVLGVGVVSARVACSHAQSSERQTEEKAGGNNGL